jgi:hypothetical protein
VDNSVVVVCERAFAWAHHLPKSTLQRYIHSANKNESPFCISGSFDEDPLCDNQKRVGGSRWYSGKAGKVMDTVLVWALSNLPNIAQQMPGKKRNP